MNDSSVPNVTAHGMEATETRSRMPLKSHQIPFLICNPTWELQRGWGWNVPLGRTGQPWWQGPGASPPGAVWETPSAWTHTASLLPEIPNLITRRLQPRWWLLRRLGASFCGCLQANRRFIERLNMNPSVLVSFVFVAHCKISPVHWNDDETKMVRWLWLNEVVLLCGLYSVFATVCGWLSRHSGEISS